MIRKRLDTLFQSTIRFFVSLLPRNKYLIVYGGSHDLFIDNAKHQFIINNEIMKGYQHVWLTDNVEILEYMQGHGFACQKSHSFKGMLTMLRAGYVLFDDSINFFSILNLSMGAVRINIWHGVPAKFIGSAHKEGDYSYYEEKHWWYKYTIRHDGGDVAISTHPSFSHVFSYSLNIPKDKILISCYPRTRTFFMSESERMDYIKKYESSDFCELYKSIKEDSRRQVIYMPTFRDKDRNYLTKAILDWEQLNEACAQAHTVLFVKVHRVTPLPNVSNFSNIRILDNGMDVYPLLPLFDRLITDYSSIMFDYALMNKQIVLYTYDINEYCNYSRPLFKHFKELLKDLTVVNDFDSLLSTFTYKDEEFRKFPVESYFKLPYSDRVITDFICKK